MNKTIKNHMKISIHLTLILLLFFGSFHLTAGTYSGGNGTVNDPYQIATYADLLELSATSADWATGKYFIQTAHIDASATATLNGGKGFVPIGNLDYKFQGVTMVNTIPYLICISTEVMKIELPCLVIYGEQVLAFKIWV